MNRFAPEYHHIDHLLQPNTSLSSDSQARSSAESASSLLEGSMKNPHAVRVDEFSGTRTDLRKKPVRKRTRLRIGPPARCLYTCDGMFVFPYFRSWATRTDKPMRNGASYPNASPTFMVDVDGLIHPWSPPVYWSVEPASYRLHQSPPGMVAHPIGPRGTVALSPTSDLSSLVPFYSPRKTPCLTYNYRRIIRQVYRKHTDPISKDP